MNRIPIKPDNELFTDYQWQAIFDGGDNLLVSASAGSGKTTVLVRRVIEKLKSGSNIDELLIVTYTEAAAREMKERIQTALREAVNHESDEKQRQHFTRQLILLPTANISTLHAFCLTVIRRFYYLIDLDPVFRMLTDETETLLLKEDVWQELREELYEENDECFFQLTENFSNDRNDDGLTNLVFALYEFSRANPNPEQWLKGLTGNYQLKNGIQNSSLYLEQLKPVILEIIKEALGIYSQLENWSVNELGLEKVFDIISSEKISFQSMLANLTEDKMEEFYRLLKELVFERYPTIRKEELKEIAQEIKKYRDLVKKDFEKIRTQYFAYSPKEMAEIMEESLTLVQKMGGIGQQFTERYYQRKLEKGVLDFNDLEHFTLQILQKKNQDGVREASEYYRKKFEEVLVDEYQDVNRLQEAILYWLRIPDEKSGNLFMVGDVKQSIYSFRLADPTLFIEKYNAFAGELGGRRIILAENFRSRKEVLDFTNLVFKQLMNEEVGQINYDEAAELVAGFPSFPESQLFHPELLIYEKESELEEDFYIEDKTDGELQMTALKIRELIDQGFLVYDKKLQSNRPVEYRDIVLLTPTKKNNIAILETFKQFNIPIEVNDAQNYFQATEIRTMISLLQIIDNPYQDIPLAAVLRSPIVGLHEGELAQIRAANQRDSFYEALKQFKTKNMQLKTRLKEFHDRLSEWREMSRREGIADLLWRIYDRTAYPEYVLGLPAGKQRHANLIALIDRAKTYEKSSFRGLYQFIRFIEKMQEKDKDLAEPLAITEENALRVMTIHASKGLEFPVVFVLDMTKQFNLQDTKARYMFEEQFGVGIRYLEPESRVLKDTLPYQAIRQIKLKKLLSEEMRKLYVALTRAEQKLFLVGSYKSREETFAVWQQAAESSLVLPAAVRMKSRGSLMDWIGMTLVRHPAMKAYTQETNLINLLKNHPAHFKIDWMSEEVLAKQVSQLHVQSHPVSEVQEADVTKDWQEQVTRVLDFNYPYMEATKTTSYQSVSEIKRLFEDPDNETAGKLIWEDQQQRTVTQFRYTEDELGQPAFMTTVGRPTTAAIGTATHTILQLLPMDQKPTKESIELVINELIAADNLDEKVAKAVKVDHLLDFFETDFGAFLLTHYLNLKREQPFAMLLPADEIFQEYKVTDDILIHGIIDGYVRLTDQLIMYDFKTDRMRNPKDQNELQKIIQRHLGQLRLYKRALSQAESLPVKKIVLVLLEHNLVLDISEML